jgi:hypothetical protein
VEDILKGRLVANIRLLYVRRSSAISRDCNFRRDGIDGVKKGVKLRPSDEIAR